MPTATCSPDTPVALPTPRVVQVDTIVVGAGQAGLAAGYELAQRDVEFLILDGAARVGDAWRERWDSLRLFTPARYSGLPGMPFPAPAMHLPDKDEVADYLERYAERFDLPVWLDARVERVWQEGGRYVLHAGGVRYEAQNVVVATGPFQRPKLPPVAAQLAPEIRQLHSSAYRSPFALPDGPALVVGAGNSGAQIALELARFRRVWLAGKETGHLPRRLLGRDLYDWLWPLLGRFTVETRVGRRLRERAGRGDPLVGIPARQLEEAGIERVGRVSEARDGFPVADGRVLRPSVVVWCTGFTPDWQWIELPVFDEHGAPRHVRGEVREAPGLFFLGLRFQHRMTSALLGGVGLDAAFVAGRVAARSVAAAG